MHYERCLKSIFFFFLIILKTDVDAKYFRDRHI